MELKHHPEEWFFLHNFDADRVFNTIQRADYLILYYIKMEADQHPEQTIYLADLAAVMGLKITELSKAVEKLQDKGLVAWKTDREAGRTYVELSSKAVELMAEERDFMKRCYARLRTELGDDELRRGHHAEGDGCIAGGAGEEQLNLFCSAIQKARLTGGQKITILKIENGKGAVPDSQLLTAHHSQKASNRIRLGN